MSRSNRHRPAITQDLLAEFAEVRQERNRLEGLERRLRERLLARLDQGAMVEPGRLGLRVREEGRPQLTFGNLAAIVGEAEAERLRAVLPVLRVRYLRVDPLAWSDPDDVPAI
jgi:hypothetical protein